jgi:hypothetical protein
MTLKQEQPERISAASVTPLLERLVSWLLRRQNCTVRRKAAAKVKEAFDGVNWSKQSFTINNGSFLQGSKGETQFYLAGEIDSAIERLNKVLRDLNS